MGATWFRVKCPILISYDAFSYLWDAPLNEYYLLGRSLTQRLVFSLCLNSAFAIACFQWMFLACSAVVIYVIFSRQSLSYNLLLSIGEAFAFSSYMLSLSAATISAEPIYLALLLMFPVSLLLLSQGKCLFPCLLGTALIMAKNTAPYFVVGLLFLYIVLESFSGSFHRKKQIICFVVLLTMALVRSQLTNRYDTSIQINVANNLFTRVFTDPAKVLYFQKQYGLPGGDYLDMTQGGTVIDCRIDDKPIVITDRYSHNYVLAEDRYGFAKWVRERGYKSWLHYILIANIKDTIRDYQDCYYNAYASDTLLALFDYHATFINNSDKDVFREMLVNTHPHLLMGLLGYEPLNVIKRIMIRAGFGSAGLTLLYLACSLILFLTSKRVRNSRTYRLSVCLIISSMGLIFAGIFGDALEVSRHVAPGMITLLMGQLLFVISLSGIAVYGLACGNLFHRVYTKGRTPLFEPESETASSRRLNE